jgi:hypothetical protein
MLSGQEEARVATEMLAGSVVKSIERIDRKNVIVWFTNGYVLFVHHRKDELEISIEER